MMAIYFSRLLFLLFVLHLAATALCQEAQGEGSRSSNESCSGNFHVMEQSLLQSTDNRFRLLGAFYPLSRARPVLVKVEYTFDGLDNHSLIWFWTESHFYLIQPLEIFQFTSLLFSNLPYRQGNVTLQLDADCNSAPPIFFQLLTARLKLYAQSATTGPSAPTQRLTDDYTAVASSWDEVREDSLLNDFVKVWLHITLALFPLGTWLLLYLCDPVQLLLGDKTWSKLDDEHSHGTVAALIQMSVIFTFYVFAMDVAGFYYTVTSDIISYDSNAAFYLSTVTGLVIDLAAFVWVVIILITSCHWDCKNFIQHLKHGDPCRGYGRIKKLISTVCVAPVLCLSNHLHYIIIAFITDAFHAGSIIIMYGISFFVFYFVFRQFYNRVVLHSNKRPKIVPRTMELCEKCAKKEKEWFPMDLQENGNGGETSSTKLMEEHNQKSKSNGKCNCFVSGPQCHLAFNTQVLMLSLMTIGPFIMLYEAILIALFISLPITSSIEDAPSRIYTIYQGTGLLIVALLTYNILLNPNPFSIPKTVERLAKRLHIPENVNYWNRLTTEEKCAKVIATLLENQFLKNQVPTTGSVASANVGEGEDESGEGIQFKTQKTEESTV